MGRKVLFYTHAFSGGGAEVVFGRLAGAFADAGDDAIFVADHIGPGPVQDRTNLRHVLLGEGHISAIFHLATLLRREKPDASFSALGAQNLKHLAAAVIAGRRHHCVLGYHGFAEAEPKRLSRISFFATPLLTRIAARTICVSDTLLENVREVWRASGHRTVRIYNPVPRSEIQAQRRRDTPPLIIACGRLVPGKRFIDLVAALARVSPNTTHLAIVGEGPERAVITAAIAEHGLTDRVKLPGHVEDMSLWYARADCVAITSESESFGLTAAEALAHGLPVVSTDCGGPVEILQSGRYGRIVSVGDVVALARALTATLADPGDSLFRLARAGVFTIETIHRSYVELIDSLR